MKRLFPLVALAVLGLPASISRAALAPTWSNGASTGVFEAGTNWLGGSGPIAGQNIFFGESLTTNITLTSPINLGGITFDQTSVNYTLGGSGLNLGIDSGGINTTGSSGTGATLLSGLQLQLTANQTWTAAAGTVLAVNSAISGAGFSLAKAGTGTLTLGATNTYSGGTTVNSGTLTLAANGALGASGSDVVINANGGSPASATLAIGNTQQTIGNITFGGASAIGGGIDIVTMGSTTTLNINGSVTYNATNSIGSAAIMGGSLSFSGPAQFNIADSSGSASELTVSSSIVGSNGLVKNGAGTLILNATNSYSGGTTINAGELDIGNGGTTGSLPSGIIADNAILHFNRSDTVGAANISGNGVVGQAGTGTLSLTGTNTYVGGTFITAGNLVDGTAGAFSPSSTVNLYGGTVTVNYNESVAGLNDYLINGTTSAGTRAVTLPIGGTVLTITGGGSNFSGAVSGLGGLTISSGAFVTLSGTNTYSGGTIIKSNAPFQSVLQIGNGGTTGSITGSITNNGILQFNRSDAGLVISGGISGSGSVNQIGSGTVTLGGANNTYSGSTSIGSNATTPGTLTDASDNALSPNSGVFIYGGTLAVTGNETIHGLGDSPPINGAISPGHVTIAGGKTLTIAGSGGTFSGAVTGSGGLTIGSGGFETLTGSNNYAGGTTINSNGLLQIGNGTSTGAISGSVVNNGSLTFNRSDSTSAGSISGTGGIAQNGAGTLTLTGANTYSGSTFVGNGTLTDAGAGSFSPNSSVIVKAGGTLTVAHSDTIGQLTDFFTSSGDVQISSSGNVSITSGTLTINGAQNLSGFPLPSTFSGPISGAGGLAIGSNASLTLAANETYAGGTTINSHGSLVVGVGGTTGSIGGTLIDNGAFTSNRSDTVTYSGIVGTGTVTQAGSGVVRLSGTNSYSGNTTVNAGTLSDTGTNSLSPSSRLILNGGVHATVNLTASESIAGLGGLGNSVGSTVNLSNAAVVTIGNGLTYAGTIAGVGSLVFSGTGSSILAGADTYSGSTTINSGTLVAANPSGSATGVGNIVIASGAALQLGGFVSGCYTNGSGSVSGDIANNGSVNFYSSNTVTYGGHISGSGLLTVGNNSSSGTLNLTNTSSYTGVTNVNSGTLELGVTNALPTTTGVAFGTGASTLVLDQSQQISRFRGQANDLSGIKIASGKTLTVAPAAGQNGGIFAGTIYGDGGFTLAGAAGTNVTLSGQSDFTGNTTINGGTLYVDSSPGSGTVNVGSGGVLGADPSGMSDVYVANNIVLASGAGLTSGSLDSNALSLSGTMTVPGGSPIVHLSGVTMLQGNLTAAASSALTLDGGGALVLQGTTDPSLTSLTLNGGGAIFAANGSIPATLSIQALNHGYAGALGGSILGKVIGQIASPAAFAGTLGLETDDHSGGDPNYYNNLNLSAFTNPAFTVGSATFGVISGSLTMSSNGYSFGNGGGFLLLQSNLGGSFPVANPLSINSISAPLSVLFQGNNTYSSSVGPTTMAVTNSLAILDSAQALPAGATIALGAGGYIGYTEAYTGAASFADFLAHRISSYTPTSVLGLDSHDLIAQELAGGDKSSGAVRVVGETLDLSNTSGLGLGTATSVDITGTIKAPNLGGAARTLNLLAVNDSHLQVDSALVSGNVNQVVLGSATNLNSATIQLNGTSTYSGGTTVNGGTLILGRSSQVNSSNTIVSGPVGTGTLSIASSQPATLLSGFSDSDLIVHNAIALNNALQLGSTDFTTDSDSEWNVNPGIRLKGAISGSGGLMVFQDTTLSGSNTFSGGVMLSNGELTIGSDTALGTGTFTISPQSKGEGEAYASLNIASGSHTITNQVFVDSQTGTLEVFGTNSLTLTGAFNFGPSLYVDPDSKFWGSGIDLPSVYLKGSVSGGRLYNDGSGSLVLSATNNHYSGGTDSSYGPIIFASSASIPAIGTLTAEYDGYIGIASPSFPTSLQTDFLSRFSAGTNGVIGFDTLPGAATNVFTGDIDMSQSQFSGYALLGSTTSAILTGTITPPSRAYRGSAPSYGYYQFGNGGGLLDVRSGLVDTDEEFGSGVYVTSISDTPLTLRLSGGALNTYSRTTEVDSSAVIFSAGSIPQNTSFVLDNAQAYIGSEDVAHVSDFIGHFPTNLSAGFIGFDVAPGGTSPITFASGATLDLSRFSSANPKIYISSTTSLLFAPGSTIILPSNATNYSFAGFKGGTVDVETVLRDADRTTGVTIGEADTPATMGNPINMAGPASTVILGGANTFTGNTTLVAGTLLLGNNAALGTGVKNVPLLDVEAMDYSSNFVNTPSLGASIGGISIPNNILLNNDLKLVGSNSFTLAGAISGEFGLYKSGTSTVTLSGDNSALSGDIYIQQGTLNFASATAAGTGALEFGNSATAAANFTVSSTINGLAGDSTNDVLGIGTGTTLTINQSFNGEYDGTINGGGSLYIHHDTEIDPSLRLTGQNGYSGGTTIGSGATVIAANNSALGTGPVTLVGGKLAVDAGTTVSNSLTQNSTTSGRLGGIGTYAPPSTISISGADQIRLAPGIAGTGTLTFSNANLGATPVLKLDGGGIYNWQISDPTNSLSGYDSVVVNGNVAITATSASLFTFRIIPIGGSLTNWDPAQSYSWAVLSLNVGSGSITGFDPAVFAFDTSSFGSFLGDGHFFITNPNGNSLQLNFTPVPEPSTWALLGVGITVLGMALRRRKSPAA